MRIWRQAKGLTLVKQCCEPGRSLALHGRQDVPVDAERHRDPLVAEALLHDVRWHAGRE